MSSNQYQPLYLKYRPQSLDELVGQKSVVKTLSNALENDRLSHAYLFTGPRGTGKTSSARILAKSINCDKGPTVSPCLECPSCESIKNSASPSVFEIDAASHNSVDDARSLIERAPLATQDGKHKLYIIDECHMLTKEAFNALLKTIEEPPPNVVFILATTEEHKVPPTIVSRCQRLMFRLVNQAELAEHLTNVAKSEKIEISDDALDLMSRRSGGGLRDALGLLDQAGLLASAGEAVQVSDLLVLLGALDEDILLNISAAVVECNGQKVLEHVNQLLLQGREASLITQELAKHFLALTKASYLSADGTISDENVQFITGSRSYVEKVVKQAQEFERAELSQIVELMDRLEQGIKRASQPALTLEMGLLSICHRLDIASVKSLTAKVKELEHKLENGDFEAIAPPRPKETTRVREREPEQVRPEPVRPEPAHQPAKAQISEEPKAATLPPVEKAPSPHEEVPAAPEPEISTPEKREPEPAPVEERTGPGPETATETDESAAQLPVGELEELWSDLLDALHKRSIPAYSLVSMHANPLSMENNQLTLGVSKEFFQKSIESKASHLENAYKALTGKEVVVKVKVVSEADQPKKKDRSPHQLKSENPPPEPVRESPVREESKQEAPSSTASNPSSPAQASVTEQPVEHEKTESVEAKPSSIAEEPKEQSSLLNEAYRLFEGPGSRLIG